MNLNIKDSPGFGPCQMLKTGQGRFFNLRRDVCYPILGPKGTYAYSLRGNFHAR